MAHLRFEPTGYTEEYKVTNKKGHDLGDISWSRQWKKFVWYPPHDTIQMSGDCCIGIGRHLNKLTMEKLNG